MIKLIASDLDGTLLEPDGTLPEGIFETIEALSSVGIRFMAASGRQYANLQRLFQPVWKEMAFVSENGAVNVVDDEIIGVVPIADGMAHEIIADIEAAGMNLLISGKRICYVLDQNREFTDDIIYRLRNNVVVLKDIREICEPMLKISGQISTGVADLAPNFLSKWGEKITATVSGSDWFDFTMADKRQGLEMVMAKLGIKADEIAAFGDNFNDEHMLALVGHPYLMEGADLRLRKPNYRLCKKVLPVLEEIIKQRGYIQ